MDGGTEMTLLRLARLSDAPPPARELLDVGDDGTLRGWRSQGPLVGACRGAAPDVDRLRALVAAAAAAPVPRAATFPLDATVESLEAGGVELDVTEHTVLDGAWGDLLEAARGLLDDALPTMPLAAVAMVIASPDLVRMEHRGEVALTVELGAARVEITRWRDGTPVGDAEVRGLGLGRTETGPGWTAGIALRGPAGKPGDLLTASAWFVADDGGVLVPVVLTGHATAG